MKRDIRCRQCALRTTQADHKLYGEAKANYRCDTCGDQLPKGTICAAVTFLRNDEHIERVRPWWNDYVECVPEMRKLKEESPK